MGRQPGRALPAHDARVLVLGGQPYDLAEVLGDPTADEVKVRRIKQLSDEAAKWRTKFREAEKALADLAGVKGRADTAETNSKTTVGQLREGRMENAFLKVAFGKVADVDAAWKLTDGMRAEVKVNEDGTVEGLEAVLAKVLESFPYLTPKPAEQVDQVDSFQPLTPSGRPNNGKRNGTDSVDYEKLAKLFPALRGRR